MPRQFSPRFLGSDRRRAARSWSSEPSGWPAGPDLWDLLPTPLEARRRFERLLRQCAEQSIKASLFWFDALTPWLSGASVLFAGEDAEDWREPSDEEEPGSWYDDEGVPVTFEVATSRRVRVTANLRAGAERTRLIVQPLLDSEGTEGELGLSFDTACDPPVLRVEVPQGSAKGSYHGYVLRNTGEPAGSVTVEIL